MTLKTLVDIQIEIDANEPILRSRPLGKSQSLNKALTLGSVHKIRLQDLPFFDHLFPSVYIFYGIKVYKKLIFFDHLPPSSCKRSL